MYNLNLKNVYHMLSNYLGNVSHKILMIHYNYNVYFVNLYLYLGFLLV